MAENYSLLAQEVQKDFQRWFGDPVPPDIPVPADTDHSNHRIRRRHVDTHQKLSELLKFGFGGAISLGTIVGFFIAYLSFWGWYSNDWPDPIVVVFLAVVMGFVVGLYKGLFTKLREQIFYKEGL